MSKQTQSQQEEKAKPPKTPHVAELKKQIEELKNKHARAVADYHNLERRTQIEKQDWIKFGNASLIERILEVADNLNRAAEYIKDPGLNMVRNNLAQVLKDFQVSEIEAEGQIYNHETMECVAKESGAENIVIKVQQKGYKLHDKVLRPAKVVVGEQDAKADEQDA
jgi:molecular chaperone GrpE